MCMGAIYRTGIERVVYCNARGEAAEIGFDDIEIGKYICSPESSPISYERSEYAKCKELLKLWEDKEDKIPY